MLGTKTTRLRRAADGCIARVIREPVRATPTSPAALLLHVGHRTAASRGETNGRTAPTQTVLWLDRFHHSGVVVPTVPLPLSMNEGQSSSPSLDVVRVLTPSHCHMPDEGLGCQAREQGHFCERQRSSRLTQQHPSGTWWSWRAGGLVMVWGGAHLSIASSHVEDLV